MLTVRLQGGLGNQLFQYAFIKSLALQKGVGFQLDRRYLLNRTLRKNFTFREYDLSIFNVEENFYQPDVAWTAKEVYADKLRLYTQLKRQQLTGKIRRKYIEPFFQYDERIVQIPNNAYCVGYFQSYRYFEDMFPQMRTDFSFKMPIDNTCYPLLQQIEETNSVALHVRRGDFVNHTFHGSVSMEYYLAAVAHLAKTENNLQLFVFSDDVHWCSQHLSFEYPTVFVAAELAGEKARNHFELMQKCRHFIISNSSFAWWAAYLGNASNKKVVAPKKWLQNPIINTNDITPPSWLRLA